MRAMTRRKFAGLAASGAMVLAGPRIARADFSQEATRIMVGFSAGGTVVGPLRAFNTQIAMSFAGLAGNPASITYGAGSVPG